MFFNLLFYLSQELSVALLNSHGEKKNYPPNSGIGMAHLTRDCSDFQMDTAGASSGPSALGSVIFLFLGGSKSHSDGCTSIHHQIPALHKNHRILSSGKVRS